MAALAVAAGAGASDLHDLRAEQRARVRAAALQKLDDGAPFGLLVIPVDFADARFTTAPDLVARLSELIKRRDAGVHSLGDFWRRGRLSCPSRQQLGSYLLGALRDEVAGYITFHLQTVGCRYCEANLADLKARQAESQTEVESRRRRYCNSSAGYLRKRD